MYKTIVVPIDLSDALSSRLTLPVALNFVNAFGAKLHLINIIPDVGISMLEEYLPKQWMKKKLKYKKSYYFSRTYGAYIEIEF